MSSLHRLACASCQQVMVLAVDETQSGTQMEACEGGGTVNVVLWNIDRSGRWFPRLAQAATHQADPASQPQQRLLAATPAPRFR